MNDELELVIGLSLKILISFGFLFLFGRVLWHLGSFLSKYSWEKK